jgi:hypothetical protein
MMRDRTSELCLSMIIISSGIVCCMAKKQLECVDMRSKKQIVMIFAPSKVLIILDGIKSERPTPTCLGLKGLVVVV